MSETRAKVSGADSDDGVVGRRSVLRGVAVGGVGLAALAACGSSDGSSDTAGSGSEPSDTGSSEPSSGGGGNGGGGGADVLGPTSDVPVGGGTVYADQEVVVTQPNGGDFLGFTAICTHMGCTVGDVSGGTINCPCHGSQYSIEDGSVVTGPATAPLASKDVSVKGKNVVLG
ncbi:MAG TPA: Rieske (2Fe-2S) protein [Nocardioidaceae bacterium]|nr:Rieske (2Fe-2S) protein [Nocardioidaceae bacterium]